MSDTCPNCGGQLEYDEVDIGVGTMRGNARCPDCHWTPADDRLPELTRSEQEQGLADRGTDTHAERLEER